MIKLRLLYKKEGRIFMSSKIIQLVFAWALGAYLLYYSNQQRKLGKSKVIIWYLVIGLILIVCGTLKVFLL